MMEVGIKGGLLKIKQFLYLILQKGNFFKYLNDKLIKNERMKIGTKVYMIKEWKEERKEG